MNFNKAKELLPYLKDPWTISWLVSGLLAIFIPLITWSANKSEYYSSYGYVKEAEDYYEQQQKYYEEQQNADDAYDAEVSYYKDCSWFNWACRKQQWAYATYDENGGNGDEEEEVLPGWFYFLGGENEEMQRWKEENTGDRVSSSSEGGLKFVYALTLILSFVLLGYGAFVIGKKQSATNLIVLLGLTATIGLMNLIMNAAGISADDKDFEDSYDGWYGQMGVLLVYTNFWMMLFSLGFCAIFLVKAFFEKKNGNKGDKVENEAEAGVYYGDVVS